MRLHWVVWDNGRRLHIPLSKTGLAFRIHRAAIRQSKDLPVAAPPTLSLSWRKS